MDKITPKPVKENRIIGRKTPMIENQLQGLQEWLINWMGIIKNLKTIHSFFKGFFG